MEATVVIVPKLQIWYRTCKWPRYSLRERLGYGQYDTFQDASRFGIVINRRFSTSKQRGSYMVSKEAWAWQEPR